MILHQTAQHLYLITQADHAVLAAQIMTAWQAPEWVEHPRRARILDAIERHDCGWREFDAAPAVNAATGHPHHVIDAPLEQRHGAWYAALEELTPRDPFVAALIAQHAHTVYARYSGLPEWQVFLAQMVSRRDVLLEEAGVVLADLVSDYRMLAIADRCSLAFCYGWTEPDELVGVHTYLDRGTSVESVAGGTLHAGRLVIAPRSVAGLELEIRARRIPLRSYASDADLREELGVAPVVQIRGDVS